MSPANRLLAPAVLLVAVNLAGCGTGTDPEPVPVPSEVAERLPPAPSGQSPSPSE